MKDKEPAIKKTNKLLKESMDTMQNVKSKSTTKKSNEDTETEILDKKRKKKQKKTKTNKTLKDTVEYAELNTLVKKNAEQEQGGKERN